MTLTPKQQFLILMAGGAIVLGGLAVGLFAQVMPALHMARDMVDVKRARITVLQEQRTNLLALKAQEDAIVKAQAAVDNETWSFLTEDEFYSRVRDLYRQAGVRGDEPRLADATPGNQPIVRNGTLDLTGTRDAILQAIRLLRAMQPVIGITEIEYRDSASVSVAISITTLWQ